MPCSPIAKRDGPLVIAHRGASGERPEHTLAAYRLAIEQGADFIEPDLVATGDGVLVARHENELASTTDVAALSEFSQLKTRKQIDGEWVEGWFSEDFTLAQIRRLRARERLPDIRPHNTRFDGQEPVPTLADIVQLVREQERAGRSVGIYLEIKHPSFFASEGHRIGGQPIASSLGRLLIDELVRLDFVQPDRVFLQSFELASLLELAQTVMPEAGVELPLILLLPSLGAGTTTRPYDVGRAAERWVGVDFESLLDALNISAPAQLDYAGLLSRRGLAVLKQVGIAGLGPSKHDLLTAPSSDAAAGTAAPAWMVAAGELSMHIHPYTLRAEKEFLTPTMDDCGGGIDDEIESLLAAGATGFFTDHPALGVSARQRFLERARSNS